MPMNKKGTSRLRSKRARKAAQKSVVAKVSQTSLATKIENSHLVRWAVVLGVFAALIGFGVQVWEYRENRLERIEATKARYWQILTTRAPGNSGKIEALEYLAQHQVALPGINLSCSYLGGLDESGKCISPTFLQEIDLSQEGIGNPEFFLGPQFHNATFDDANFWLAKIPNASFFSASLRNTDLSSAALCGTDFREADLTGASLGSSDARFTEYLDTIAKNADFSSTNFGWAVFHGTDLTNADISHSSFHRATFGYETDARRVKLNGSNISGSDFTDAVGVEFVDFQDTWAWADTPPIGLPEEAGPDHLCAPPGPVRLVSRTRPTECILVSEILVPSSEDAGGGQLAPPFSPQQGGLDRLRATAISDLAPPPRFPERCAEEVLEPHYKVRARGSE